VGTHGWRPGVAERLEHYVYLLIDPRDQQVFYVGKGQGGRCFQHIVEARKTIADSVGDYPKLVRIREIEKSGCQVMIELLQRELDEPTAWAVEAAAIDLLGRITLNRIQGDNRIQGHTHGNGLISVDEANYKYGAIAVDFDPAHKVILVRIARQFYPTIDPEGLYKATREWWKIGRHRRDGGPRSPQWAMAVYRGVIRAVYRIKRWVEPTEEEVRTSPTIKGRWAFDGLLDSEMTERYGFADVTHWLPQSAQNPIRYVNCDSSERLLLRSEQSSPAP